MTRAVCLLGQSPTPKSPSTIYKHSGNVKKNSYENHPEKDTQEAEKGHTEVPNACSQLNRPQGKHHPCQCDGDEATTDQIRSPLAPLINPDKVFLGAKRLRVDQSVVP